MSDAAQFVQGRMPPRDSAGEDDGDTAGHPVGDHATAEDSLGFHNYVVAVAAFLRSKQTTPPLTISIEGEWGSGKSSFMLQLEKIIAGPSRREIFLSDAPAAWGGSADKGSFWTALQKAVAARQRPVIRFNAWRHDKQDALWAAFALAVSQRLRQRIGFWRGLRADAHLLFLRLNGLRGWLELLLAIVSFSLLLLSVYALGSGLYHYIHTHTPCQFHEKAGALLFQKDGPPLITLLLNSTAARFHGSWFGALLIACAGLIKFQDQVKLPIAIDLKKYLSTPDYKGHSAFVESFHEDFAKLVRAYAGEERVYVFIDDLDRCDVPRAAELMQAINLMISDAGNLVFIIGMDREKVAAGLTQKYKDLLPYLPEYTTGVFASNPVVFGYSYLEKFVQLTFTLPIMASEDALDKFLNSLLPIPAKLPWRRAVAAYWKANATERWNHIGRWFQLQTRIFGANDSLPYRRSTGSGGPAPAAPRSAKPKSVDTEMLVERLTLEIAREPEKVHAVVRMVSPLFGNNPRRLKQFLSTYRLALTLTYGQGILAKSPNHAGVTMQQLGKFVALTLRFPDLRAALLGDANILRKLELAATDELTAQELTQQTELRWLQNKAACDLLKHGIWQPTAASSSYWSEEEEEEENRRARLGPHFSLRDVNTSLLLSLLPRAAEPVAEPAQSSAAEPKVTASNSEVEPIDVSPMERLQEFAAQYRTIRSTMPSGPARTQRLDTLFLDFVDYAHSVDYELTTTAANLMSGSNYPERDKDEGNRIVHLALAFAYRSSNSYAFLVELLRNESSRFEHYWTLRTLAEEGSRLGPAFSAEVAQILRSRMGELEHDSARLALAETVLEYVSWAENSSEVA